MSNPPNSASHYDPATCCQLLCPASRTPATHWKSTVLNFGRIKAGWKIEASKSLSFWWGVVIPVGLGAIASLGRIIADVAGLKWLANLLPWVAVLCFVAVPLIVVVVQLIWCWIRNWLLENEIHNFRSLSPRAASYPNYHPNVIKREFRLLRFTVDYVAKAIEIPVHVLKHFLSDPTEIPRDEILRKLETVLFLRSGYFSDQGGPRYSKDEAQRRFDHYMQFADSLLQLMLKDVEKNKNGKPSAKAIVEMIERFEVAIDKLLPNQSEDAS